MPNVGEDVTVLIFSCAAGRSVDRLSHFGKSIFALPSQIRM